MKHAVLMSIHLHFTRCIAPCGFVPLHNMTYMYLQMAAILLIKKKKSASCDMSTCFIFNLCKNTLNQASHYPHFRSFVASCCF